MWYRGVTDDRHTLSTYSEHVYNEIVLVETSIIINYCAIFRCNANTSHHREQVLFILRFHTNDICFTKLKPEFSWRAQVRHRLRFVL